MTNRIWKNIPGIYGYQASNLGEIRRSAPGKKTFSGKKLNPTFSTNYYVVTLTINGKHKTFQVHNLVAFAFHGLRPFDGSQAAHLDGNPKNNKSSNLKWVTPSENALHRYGHGTMIYGENCSWSKITEKDARDIKSMKGLMREIGAKYNISRHMVSYIKRGLRWKHI